MNDEISEQQAKANSVAGATTFEDHEARLKTLEAALEKSIKDKKDKAEAKAKCGARTWAFAKKIGEVFLILACSLAFEKMSS